MLRPYKAWQGPRRFIAILCKRVVSSRAV